MQTKSSASPAERHLGRKFFKIFSGILLTATLLTSITVATSSSSNFEFRPAYGATASSSSASALIVPMYSWPVKYVNGVRYLSDPWQGLYNTATANPNLKIIMILNPDSGNFGLGSGYLDQATMTSAQPNADIYWAEQQMKRAPNIVVIGYIYTGYAARDISTVEQRIDLYKKLYNTTGILFDEMANTDGKQQYYSGLTAYAKNNSGMTFTAGNPGTSTLESYIGTVDTLIIYEDKGLPSLDTIKARTFNGKYDKFNFGATPYSVTRYDSKWVLNNKSMVGYIYVTNDTAPNPWDTLSKYITQLARDSQ